MNFEGGVSVEILRYLEFRAAPDHLKARDFVDRVPNALLFDAVTEPPILGHEFELQLASIIDGEINPRRMFAALSRCFDRLANALGRVHSGIVPQITPGPV